MWHTRAALRLFTCLGTLWAWPAVTSTFSDDFYKARPVAKPCPNCTTSAAPRSFVDLQEQIELEAQLQRIKQKIIEGLGLKDIPGITSSPGTPAIKHPARQPSQAEDTERYKLDDIIATSEEPSGINGKSVLQFQIQNPTEPNVEVRRGFLYVFLKKKKRAKGNKRIMLRVSTVNEKGKPKKLLSSVKTILKESRWQTIGLPSDLLKKVLTNPGQPLKLHLRCKKCKRIAKPILVSRSTKRDPKLRAGVTRQSGKRKSRLNRNRPRLLIHTKSLSSRSKRHLQGCQGTGNRRSQSRNEIVGNYCCRHSYYLNFTELGFIDWIISPVGVLVSVCDGSCSNRRQSTVTTMVNGETARVNRQCLPTKRSNLTILYIDQSMHVVQKRLPNMIIDSCGCRYGNTD